MQEFTCREKQLVDLIVDGHSDKSIGTLLGITRDTVRRHLANIFDKVGCDSRFQLAQRFSLLAEAGFEHKRGVLLAERGMLIRRLNTIDKALKTGDSHEAEVPVVDYAARAGIAIILADVASGHPE